MARIHAAHIAKGIVVVRAFDLVNSRHHDNQHRVDVMHHWRRAAESQDRTSTAVSLSKSVGDEEADFIVPAEGLLGQRWTRGHGFPMT